MFNSKKTGTLVLLFSFFFLTFIISCTKKSDEKTKTDDKTEMVEVGADNFNESDDDILTVDYRDFYDELAPSGEWIEVTGNDIGVDLKKSTATGENGSRKITLSELFGIKDAVAGDVNFGSFFVWKPAAGLSVGVTAGEPAPPYEPYRNGQWINTDAGWYFKAASPPEEITHHYGRWVLSPSAGWLWVPGRVWSPAWVDWSEDEQYVGWVPVPPSIYIANNVVIVPPMPVEKYYIVEKKYFVEPSVYKYMYKENKNKIMIKEWRRIDGVMVMNKTVINKGPDVKIIEKYSGSTLNVVKVNKVKKTGDVKYTETEISVLSPEFKKNKSAGNRNSTANKPGKYTKFEEKIKENETGTEKKEEIDKGKDKDKGKDEDKGKKEDKDNNKDKGKENKDKEKNDDKSKGKTKLGDDSNMKDGKNKEKSNDNNDKGKQEKGKDKGKK